MKLSETKFMVLDTETTGLDPTVDKVVDIALVPVHHGQVLEGHQTLVNPGMPIPPEASAVHHITNKDVANQPTITEASEKIKLIVWNTVIVAHNAQFDRSFYPLENPWLCTYRLARHLWPDLKMHTNQYLRYYFGIDVGDVSVHRAHGDAVVTSHLLLLMIDEYLKNGGEDDIDELLNFTNAPIMVQTMPFGKHHGVPMKEVPKEYLEWALKNLADLDDDLKGTMKVMLERKVGA